MGFFKNLKNKANQLINSNEDTSEIEEKNQIENHEEDEDIDNEIDFDETQIPEAWEEMTDDEILAKLSAVLLKYQQSGEDEEYLKQEGFVSEDHLMAFQDYFRAQYREKTGKSTLDALGMETIAVQEQTIKAAEKMKGEGGLLEPVEGISCEEWAKVSAGIASGKSLDDLLKIAGMDNAKWDRINGEWQTRMANDTTFVIAQVYGNAFNASATGNLGSKNDINEENFPFEKYVEISVAQDKLTAQGKDPQEVLGLFGLTVTDWSNASAFWSNKMNQNMEHYHQEYTRLQKIYEEKYKTGSVHDDIEF